jgi:ATP-dependent helicase/nuclease subunit B
MVCRFILGAAGAGKSYYCLNKLAEKVKSGNFDRPAVLIVPEQATFFYESRLIKEFALPGFTHVEISSFNRLAWRARNEMRAVTLPSLSESGRIMIIAHILAEKKKELKFFRGGLKSGFSENLLRIFDEFKACNISSPALNAFLRLKEAENHEKIINKLRDIVLLYESYLDYCRDKYTDSSDGLRDLGNCVNEGFLRGGELYLDGFSYFTPWEEYVIAAFFRNAFSVNIALAMNPSLKEKTPARENLFYPLWRCYQRLTAIAEKLTPLADAVLLPASPRRFPPEGELAFMEKNLFSFHHDEKWNHPPQAIKMRVSSTPYGEIYDSGREILRLVREEGLRYQDISVIARSAAVYEEDFRQVFGLLGIPFFLDGKKNLFYHPLADIVRALWAVVSRGPRYDLIFRYLKNPLSPLEPDECCKLENYCLAAGTRFFHWASDNPWDFWPQALGGESAAAEAEALRLKAFKVVGDLMAALAKTENAGDYCRALSAALRQLNIGEKLRQWSDLELAKGENQNALIHSAAWEGLESLLSEAETFMGELSLSREDFADIIESGLRRLEINIIPPGIDQVFIASADRSRNPEIKAAFIIGVNEGEMPSGIKGDALLTESERQFMGENGFNLAPGAEERQLAENYLIYIACTRPSSKLYLSFSTSDREGGARAPSFVIGRFKELFPLLREECPTEGQTPSQLSGGKGSIAVLGSKLEDLRKGFGVPVFWGDVYNWYSSKPEYAFIIKMLAEGLSLKPYFPPLGGEIIARLYGDKLRSSVSRLEKFNACPFAYFATYGLKLKERPFFSINPMDRGSLFHAVLADLAAFAMKDVEIWHETDCASAKALISGSLKQRFENMLGKEHALMRRQAYISARFERILNEVFLLWREHIKRSSFMPLAKEIAFGAEAPLQPLSLPLPAGGVLEISGVIDRVDMAVAGENAWFRVIDYKTGAADIKKENMLKGLNLQLLVYLQVVMNNASLFWRGQAFPAGAYYFPIRNALDSIPLPAPEEEDIALKPRLNGITVKDEHGVRLADNTLISGYSELIPVALKKDGGFYKNSPGLYPYELEDWKKDLTAVLENTAGRILSGEINAAPQSKKYSPLCLYCAYMAICGLAGEAARAALDDDFGGGNEYD